jgi:hypothetical protein
MTIADVRTLLGALGFRERLIAKFAILGGLRPGEIFGLTWGSVASTHADIVQRLYRGQIDTPKTSHSVRQAALTDGLLAELEGWRGMMIDPSAGAFVFPSEKGTALSKDNVWNRNMRPKLTAVGLSWANFSGDAPDARDAYARAQSGPEARGGPTRAHRGCILKCVCAIPRGLVARCSSISLQVCYSSVQLVFGMTTMQSEALENNAGVIQW